MIKLKSLLAESQFEGSTFISVDIQPEYRRVMGFSPDDFTDFLNKNYNSFNRLVFLYNGSSLGFPDEHEYMLWLFENGLNEEIVNHAKFYDKGYAFFRYCIDSFIDEDAIVNFVRFMYQNNINDSRDMNRDMWAKYLRQYRRTDKKEIFELLQHSDDCVNIPDVMEFLRPYSNIVLTGGGVDTCLKEVEIALRALNKNYKIFPEFTY